MTVTVTEPTTSLRDWLRTHADIVAALPTDGAGKRTVYAGGLPATPSLPAVVLNRIGGDVDDLGVDSGLYQFDCWADTASAAGTVAGVIQSLLLNTTTTTIASGLSVDGASIESSIYFPDPDSPDTHRYIVTAQVVTKARTT